MLARQCSKTLQARLQQFMNQKLPDVQAGFKKGRGTKDQIANIHEIIEKAREFQKNIYFCFTGYAKASDCVDHNKLFNILQEMGIPDHLTCLLRNLYAGQETTIRTRHGTMDWFQIGKGVHQGCISSPCLFNLYAEYITQNAGLHEAQGATEASEEGEREDWKSWFKTQHSKNEDHGIQSHHFMANRRGKCGSSDKLYSQSYGFSTSHVRMWELVHKEGWVPKNWQFWTVVLEKTLESPLDYKEIKPVDPKGNQPWIFIGRTDTEAPIFWPPDAKSRLTGKDPHAGKDWGQGETEDGDRGWMASLTQWTWVWANSGRQWREKKPGLLQSMGMQRVRHERLSDWTGGAPSIINTWVSWSFSESLCFLIQIFQRRNVSDH